MSDDDRLERLDYYTLLGVPRDASVEQIRVAFRVFARKYHPDRFAGGPPEKIARATQIYRRGSEAFQTLTHLESRKAYDVALARGELRLRTDPRAVSGTADAASPPARPSSSILSPMARAYYARAVDAARTGDLRAAHRLLEQASQQEPGNPLIAQALERVRAQLRRF